jgi:hypothetical protein
VYNKKNGEPVIFTNVFLVGTSMGAQTDVNGFYSITKIPAGSYTISINAIGFDPLEQQIAVTAGQLLNKNLTISEKELRLKEFEITSEKENEQSRVGTSVTTITSKEMNRLPTIGADPDLAQYLQVLPGVTFTGDQGGQLYIRGGSPIQNKVLLDGMIIYNPFHSIGLFSVFDTDVIRNTEVYTGGFGAEYGGEGVSLTFHVDRDMNVKKFFDEWTAVVVDPDTGLVNYQENYISTINLRQLNEQENVTYELELFEAFPRSVNLLELNNSAQNQTHRLNVLFAYRYWKDKGRDFQTTPMDIPLRRRIPEIPVEDTRLRNVTPTGQFDIGTTNQDMAFGVNGLSG